MKWINVKKGMPIKKHGTWSENDVLCLCKYSFEIGRTRNGVWVDMKNNEIEVTHWMPLPEPPNETP